MYQITPFCSFALFLIYSLAPLIIKARFFKRFSIFVVPSILCLRLSVLSSAIQRFSFEKLHRLLRLLWLILPKHLTRAVHPLSINLSLMKNSPFLQLIFLVVPFSKILLFSKDLITFAIPFIHCLLALFLNLYILKLHQI